MFFVYELFQTLCFFILRFVAIFTGPGKFAKFAAFKDNSEFLRRIDEAAATLEAMGADKPECVWLHVASAGELEQAVPILRAIAELGKIVFFVSYFSPDTEPFLKNVPALLCAVGFPADVRSNHEHVIRSLGIRRIFLVRYDFWPAFLHSAKRAKVEINLLAATSNNARNNLASTLFGHWKAFAYSYFSNIFVVADSDVAFFQKLAPLAKVHLAGDPKWYRAKSGQRLFPSRVCSQDLVLSHTSAFSKNPAADACVLFLVRHMRKNIRLHSIVHVSSLCPFFFTFPMKFLPWPLQAL